MFKWLKKYYLLWALTGLIVIFVSVNLILNLSGGTAALDMTSSRSYSLSEYSEREAKSLSSPLFITVYYSSEIMSDNPVYGRYAEFVLQFLQQYHRLNPEKISIAVKNPEPYSETEKEARAAGLKFYPSSTGESNLYFGAVFSDTDGNTQKIDGFSIEREFWLEKDITSVLAAFNNHEKKTIGLISPVHKLVKKEYGKETELYAFMQELTDRYNILELRPDIKEIPLDVNVLLVAAPRDIPPTLMYALDQYVMRGGRLIMLLDLFVEEPYYKTKSETINRLNRLMQKWGVSVSHTLTGSRPLGRKVFMEMAGGERRQVSYPLWLDIPEAALNQDSPITKGLKNIYMKSPLEITETEHDENISVTPLIKIEEGAVYNRQQVIDGKYTVIKEYQADEKPHALAVWIEGKMPSIYLSVPNFALEDDVPYMFYSAIPTQILVVGDSDFINDNNWMENGVLHDNGQFVMKAVELMSGQEDMAALYKRQSKQRQESLGSRIYAKVTEQYTDKISNLQNELESLTHEHDGLMQAVREKVRNMDAYTSGRLEEIRGRIKEINDNLKFYDYEIKRVFAFQTQKIVFINLVAIPLLEILILILGYNWYSRKKQKKIKEKYNARG